MAAAPAAQSARAVDQGRAALPSEHRRHERPVPFDEVERSGRAGQARFACFFSRRRRTCTRIGEPPNPNFSRSWFTRYRSYEKCSVVATLVKNTNEGGATPICAA